MADRSAFRIKGLDGLRAIAVLLVFLHHKTKLAKYDVGDYGVWLFFVLSGFLIVNILHKDRLKVEQGAVTFGRSLKNFVARRALRIFPIYYLTLFATILSFAHNQDALGRQHPLWQDAFNFLYLTNIWIGNICGVWVGKFSHLWSLSIEEQFYLIGAVVFLIVPARLSALVCILTCALSLATIIWLEATGTSRIVIYTNSFINFGFIAYGGLCGLLMRTSKPEPGRSTLVSASLLLAYLAVPVVLAVAGQSETLLLSMPALLLIGPLLMSICKNQTQPLVNFLEAWPLRLMGKVSYGFYLYHNFITYELIEKVLRSTLHIEYLPPPSLQVFIVFVISLVVAALSWSLIEKPLLSLRPRSEGGLHDLPQATVAEGRTVA